MIKSCNSLPCVASLFRFQLLLIKGVPVSFAPSLTVQWLPKVAPRTAHFGCHRTKTRRLDVISPMITGVRILNSSPSMPPRSKPGTPTVASCTASWGTNWYQLSPRSGVTTMALASSPSAGATYEKDASPRAPSPISDGDRASSDARGPRTGKGRRADTRALSRQLRPLRRTSYSMRASGRPSVHASQQTVSACLSPSAVR